MQLHWPPNITECIKIRWTNEYDKSKEVVTKSGVEYNKLGIVEYKHNKLGHCINRVETDRDTKIAQVKV